MIEQPEEEKKEEGVESPYVKVEPVEEPAFDYDAHRDNTTSKAVTAIFKILGENAERLTYKSDATTEKIEEAEGVVVQQMMEAIIENRVPEGDMQTLIDTFTVVLHRLFDTISRMKKEYEREFLARALNGRNPGDNHYSREYSTIGDLYVALEKIRTEQKDDAHGYFYVAKKQG